MKISAKVVGLEKVRRSLAKHGQAGIDAFRGAMYAEGLSIMDKAVENTPADKGGLRNSHFVTHPGEKGNVTIGYGAKYARWMEFVGDLSKASARQRRAAFAAMKESKWRKSAVGFAPGFFRRAIDQAKSGMVQRIASSAKRYFRAGGMFPLDASRASSAAEGAKRSKQK